MREPLQLISARFDLDQPLFQRLAPLAQSLQLPADWRVAATANADVGNRPPLASLGPFRWQPYAAPDWTLADSEGKKHSLADYHGRPVLVVFYLGHGCTHCLEQLNLLAPAAKEFQSKGISIVAVSTDNFEGLRQTAKKATAEDGFPFPLLSDESLTAFKAYRTYDDFERMALHGTFLIDGSGRVRWQDISYEPFREMKFLIAESRRLLELTDTKLAAR